MRRCVPSDHTTSDADGRRWGKKKRDPEATRVTKGSACVFVRACVVVVGGWGQMRRLQKEGFNPRIAVANTVSKRHALKEKGKSGKMRKGARGGPRNDPLQQGGVFALSACFITNSCSADRLRG